MNRLTAFMAALGAFGTPDLSSTSEGRPFYPYPLRSGTRPKSGALVPHYRKKGPGRRHTQGKAKPVRRFERKLATCRGNAKA